MKAIYVMWLILTAIATATINSIDGLCFMTINSKKYGNEDNWGYKLSDLPILRSGLVSSSHRLSRIYAC